jgi:hypothetical protein
MQQSNQASVVDLHPRTKGKRVLYIGNRADGVLQEELSRALQAARFKFGVLAGDNPSRVRSVQASIAHGTFDVVLVAEGFVSHNVYDALASACKASQTPTVLVRVGRGRVAEVQRAISGMTLPPPRLPPPDAASINGKFLRWTGPEFARLEDLALEGKSDPEIALALKNEFGVVRSEQSVRQTRIDCFGIVRGKQTKAVARKLPQSYHDIRQAQRIRQDLSAAVAAPAEDPAQAPALEPEPVAAAQPAIAAAAPPRKTVPVSITGSRGIVLLESTRSLEEIVKFLIGET